MTLKLYCIALFLLYIFIMITCKYLFKWQIETYIHDCLKNCGDAYVKETRSGMFYIEPTSNQVIKRLMKNILNVRTSFMIRKLVP